jgi:hypothetical protein
MRKRIRCSLLRPAFVLLFLATASESGSEEPHPLGVVDFENYGGVEALGGRWMRVPLEWRYIEPEDDVFEWSSAFTVWLDQAEALGIGLIPVVAVGQCWASGFEAPGSVWPSYPPTDLQTTYDPVFAYSESYYDFIYHFAQHYDDRIDRVTIENEVNTTQFWAGSGDEYVRLLATARKAVDDAGAAVLIYDSGLGSGSWGVTVVQWMIESGNFTDEEILSWANAYYQYDQYVNVQWGSYQELVYWLYQPYVQENIARVNHNLATVGAYVDGLNFKFTESAWFLPELIRWIDQRLALHGYDIPHKTNNEASNWPRGSAIDEGSNLFKMIVGGLGWGVQQSVWFPYSNQLDDTPRRGLLDENGEWTRQAYAFRNIHDRLGSTYRFVEHDTLGDGQVLRFRFQSVADTVPRIDAMWWDDGSHGNGTATVRIGLPPNTVTIRRYEYDGTLTEFPATGDTLMTSVYALGRFYQYVPDIPIGVEPAELAGAGLLAQNAPNPFRPRTALRFRLPDSGTGGSIPYSLDIFDVGGRLIRVLERGSGAPGWRSTSWNGTDESGKPVPSGNYWYRLTTPRGMESRRMTLMR